MSNVNAAALGGLAATNFWQLGGNNIGTGQFLGSTNNQPFEIRVNGQRAFRLQPNIDTAPSLLGGSPLNFIAVGTSGAVIAGGGTANYFGSVLSNSIASDYDFIGGGIGNDIGTNAAFSAIAAGYVNEIGPNSDRSFIDGRFRAPPLTVQGATPPFRLLTAQRDSHES